jgi:hypothetical protein
MQQSGKKLTVPFLAKYGHHPVHLFQMMNLLLLCNSDHTIGAYHADNRQNIQKNQLKVDTKSVLVMPFLEKSKKTKKTWTRNKIRSYIK